MDTEYTLQMALEELVKLDLQWDFAAFLVDDIADYHIMQLCLEAFRREAYRSNQAEQTLTPEEYAHALKVAKEEGIT